MIDVLKELCLLNGISGREDAVREYIISKIKSFDDCKYYVDNLGNLIVEKKGKKRAKNKVMLDAHMDEVGFMITDIDPDGFLKFSCVGGIDPSVLPAQRVNVNGKVGAIGVKPVHLLEKSEKNKYDEIEKMYIDIGASSKEEAAKYVSPGDGCFFESDFVEFGDALVKSKALDDRLGCAILLDLLGTESEYDFVCTFSVQEEVGARGASVLCAQVEPDYAIVVETTTACDIDGVSHDKQVCRLSDGPVVSFMDRGAIYDREIYKTAFSIAKENGIPVQTKTLVAGGNNSSSILTSHKGVRTCAVSVPCRYLHSPACVINKNDIKPTVELIKLLVKKLCDD
ncbi:MAG: M42 family peptidase [Clostridia bacterium]|nr:M42 family peptidase [Clostridia bacterium]